MREEPPAFAVLGGDVRQAELARCFVLAGHAVRAVGLPAGYHPVGAVLAESVVAALDGAGVAIAPVQGIDARGTIFTLPEVGPLRLTRDALAGMRPGGVLFTGIASPPVREWAGQCGIRLEEYRDRDEFAIYNSVPSAEGAIQMAMEQLPITLHGSSAWVLGFGRTGETLCRMLQGIGARVTAVARSPVALARATAAGHQAVQFAALQKSPGGSEIGAADVVFNTVPAPVLTAEVLSRLQPDALVIDLASAPGGTDFEAARQLGIRALLAPGLPGKVAPRTAGRIIYDLVIRSL